MKLFTRLGAVTGGLLMSSVLLVPCAMADSCSDLDKNPKWTKLLHALEVNMAKGDYNAAIANINDMQEICSRSPLLNHMAGRLYRTLGNETKALYFFQKATTHTDEFKLKPEILEQIWYERYEAEHPEAKRVNLEKIYGQTEEISAENEKLRRDFMMKREEVAGNAYKVMWTGVAIGTAGLLATAAGGTIIGVMGDPVSLTDDAKIRLKGLNNAGWALIGSGIGLLVAGSIVAGISGYQYVQNTGASETTAFVMDENGLGIRF